MDADQLQAAVDDVLVIKNMGAGGRSRVRRVTDSNADNSSSKGRKSSNRNSNSNNKQVTTINQSSYQVHKAPL